MQTILLIKTSGRNFSVNKSKSHFVGVCMGKSKMTSKAARRIQSHADKTGRNQSFKSRAQSSAAKSKK